MDVIVLFIFIPLCSLLGQVIVPVIDTVLYCSFLDQ